MITRLSRILIALALASSIGMHWAFLQSVAWVGMVVTYSQTAPVSVAIAQTFDGKHPCCLCNEIAQAQKTEKQADQKVVVKGLELCNPPETRIFVATPGFYLLRTSNLTALQVFENPPTPPPQSA